MRLLLAVDINNGAKGLIAQAVGWAQPLGATLDLIYVDDLHLVQDPEVRTLLDRERQRINDTQRARLEQLRLSIPEEIRGEALYRAGWVPGEIVEAARGYDAVLISTHGRRGLSNALLGSVAERVVRLSPVPVLVLRQLPAE